MVLRLGWKQAKVPQEPILVISSFQMPGILLKVISIKHFATKWIMNSRNSISKFLTMHRSNGIVDNRFSVMKKILCFLTKKEAVNLHRLSGSQRLKQGLASVGITLLQDTVRRETLNHPLHSLMLRTYVKNLHALNAPMTIKDQAIVIAIMKNYWPKSMSIELSIMFLRLKQIELLRKRHKHGRKNFQMMMQVLKLHQFQSEVKIAVRISIQMNSCFYWRPLLLLKLGMIMPYTTISQKANRLTRYKIPKQNHMSL